MRGFLATAGFLLLPGLKALKAGSSLLAWSAMIFYLASASVLIHWYWISPRHLSWWTWRSHFNITTGYLGTMDLTPETTFILSVADESQSIRRHEPVWPRYPEIYSGQRLLVRLAHGFFFGLWILNALAVLRQRGQP